MPASMIVSSLFFAVSSRVSNQLGAGNAIGAKRTAMSGLMLSLMGGLIVATSLLTFRKSISVAFTKDAAVSTLVELLIWPQALFQFCAAVSRSFEGIVQGSGRQSSGALVVIISYFVFGLPVSWILGSTMGLGVTGLVIGRVVGKVIHLMLYGTLCYRTDWDEQAEHASKQYSNSKKND